MTIFLWASSAGLASLAILLYVLMNLEKSNKVPPWPVYRLGMFLLHHIEKFKTRILPASVRILELSNAFWQTQALRVAAELEIADILHKEGPKTCQQIADIIKERTSNDIHVENLCRVLRALENIGVFREDGKITSSSKSGLWHNTHLSDVLRRDHPTSQRSWVINAAMTHYPPCNNLIHSVRTGESAFESLHNGQPFFDYLQQNPIEGQYFHEGMHNLQAFTGQTAINDYPNWKAYTSICDVGGGEGRLLAGLMKTHPHIKKGVIFDLPEVIELSKKRYEEEEPAAIKDRTSFVGGDFFGKMYSTQVPECDVYLLKWILHDWNDDNCVKILQFVKKAMKPGSKLLILDSVLTKSDPLPVKKRFSDLLMMVMLHGKERSKEDFASLFARSGLRLDSVYETRGPVSVIEASLAE